MRREALTPRPDWCAKVKALGLVHGVLDRAGVGLAFHLGQPVEICDQNMMLGV